MGAISEIRTAWGQDINNKKIKQKAVLQAFKGLCEDDPWHPEVDGRFGQAEFQGLLKVPFKTTQSAGAICEAIQLADHQDEKEWKRNVHSGFRKHFSWFKKMAREVYDMKDQAIAIEITHGPTLKRMKASRGLTGKKGIRFFTFLAYLRY